MSDRAQRIALLHQLLEERILVLDGAMGTMIQSYQLEEKDYRGKQAMIDTGVRAKCVTVLIDGPDDADPWGREALLLDGEKVGRLTSGGYSVHFGKQIGIGYVRPDLAEPGQKLQLRMFRELYDAEVVAESPYDPTNATIRANG